MRSRCWRSRTLSPTNREEARKEKPKKLGDAALGCQITRNIFSEVGYRYLYDDFRDTNFLYQLSLHGAQITAGINF